MANLLDYLDWRGDLTLDKSPFNEVDNLILAELSFVDFKDIVPAPSEGESVALRDAAEACKMTVNFRWAALYSGVAVGIIPLRNCTAAKEDDSWRICWIIWTGGET